MRVAITAVAALLAVTSCGGDEEPSPTQPSPTATGTSSPQASEEAVASPIVGDWERVMTCEERVTALVDAGLGRFAAEHVAGNEMIPGISFDEPELIDPENPCKGAVPRKHGHFFTSDGSFGSTDHRGEQVDDGTFEVVDAHTVVISNPDATVTFKFRIEHAELFLDPVMPSCVKTGCWQAQWAVAVASPGRPWRRSGR
jgi:hypothetical protein